MVIETSSKIKVHAKDPFWMTVMDKRGCRQSAATKT